MIKRQMNSKQGEMGDIDGGNVNGEVAGWEAGTRAEESSSTAHEQLQLAQAQPATRWR